MHASRVLRAFQSSGEALRLRDVVERTGLGKGLCFRLLHTLHHIGLVEKVDATRYRLTSEIGRRRRYRIGYAAQGQDSSFPREVLAGLQRAADRESVELIVRRQPLPAEGGPAKRRAPGSRAGRSRHRVPDGRSHRAGHRLQVPGGPDPAHRDRRAPSRCHLLRGQQLPGRAARGTAPGAMGEEPLAGTGGRSAAAGARPRGFARARADERRARRPSGDRSRSRRSLPRDLDRLRRAVQDGTREGAKARPGIQGPLRRGRSRERSERAGCHAGLSGSRPGGHLCDRRAQRGGRRPGGAARAADAVRRRRSPSSRSDTATASSSWPSTSWGAARSHPPSSFTTSSSRPRTSTTSIRTTRCSIGPRRRRVADPPAVRAADPDPNVLLSATNRAERTGAPGFVAGMHYFTKATVSICKRSRRPIDAAFRQTEHVVDAEGA